MVVGTTVVDDLVVVAGGLHKGLTIALVNLDVDDGALTDVAVVVVRVLGGVTGTAGGVTGTAGGVTGTAGGVTGTAGAAVLWKHLQALDMRLAGKTVMYEGAVPIPARYTGQNFNASKELCSKARSGLSSWHTRGAARTRARKVVATT